MKSKLLLIITCLFLFPLVIFADETHPYEEFDASFLSGYEYYIKEYDIDMKVNENNTFDITENLTVYFNTYKHGIYRSIPKKNKITRLDNSTSENRAFIRNIEVSENYDRELDNGYLTLKIGDENKVIIGEKKYTISYNYDIGRDPLKDADELYFNLIGNYWEDTIIEHTTFKITMPKNFDASTLGFSKGLKGSADSSNIEYEVDDNIIRGQVNTILKEKEGLTVRLTLPEGYFVIPDRQINVWDIISIIFSILGAIFSFFMWNKFGKDDLVVKTVEFYPPNKLDCLEIAYIDHNYVMGKDATALLIVLANKGYLKIEETFKERDKNHKHPIFKVVKIKDYDGKDEYEKVFFETLFLKKNKNLGKLSVINKIDKEKPEGTTYYEALIQYKIKNNEKVNEVTKEDLYDNFYHTIEFIEHKTNTKEHKEKYYEKKASKKSIYIAPIWLVVFCLMFLPSFIYYGEYEYMLICMIMSLVTFEIFQAILGKTVKGLLWGTLTFIPTLVPLCIFALPMIQGDLMFFIEYVISYVCLTIIGVTDKNMSKRTKLGTELYGKVQGFKEFLKTAEKEKIEAMVEENPSYFYDILPYTYVLNVSDKWMKNLEFLNVQAPNWYVSENAFSIDTFTSFMTSTISSVDSAMTGSPSSDTGGGSSGGGSGGGGGGSW